MGFDIDKIQGNIGGPDKPGKGFDPTKVQQGAVNPLLGGPTESTNFDEFNFQPKTNADNYKLRAQNQGMWESSLIRLGNLVPNIAGGIVEGVGYLGSLATEWGDDRDYNNQLTQFGNSMKNPFGTVYRENPEKTWDLSDPAWWGDAFFSLVESAASFAVEGAGLAKIFGSMTSLAEMASAGKKVLQGTRAANQLLTSATLAYTEGAQIGAQVFDDAYTSNYNKFREQGLDADQAHDQAKHIAANAAARTVQLNTIMNTALNLPEVAPLFTHEDDILSWWKKAGKQQAGETYDDFARRIKDMDPMKTDGIKALLDPRHVGYTHYGLTALSEGAEEINNNFAEARGRAAGKEGKTTKSIGDMLGDAGHYFDDVLNSEGALSFVLGALGGIAQPVMLDSMPIHRVAVDEKGNYSTRSYDGEATPEGKFKTALVSSRTLTATGHRQVFDNVKDKVVADINRIDELKTKIAEATAKGDGLTASRLKHQLFDVGALNSVQLGIGDAFAAQFKNIENLDNEKDLGEAYEPKLAELKKAIDQETDQVRKKELEQERDATVAEMQKMKGKTEAMVKGYAKSMNDNEYKTTAREAAQDIEDYSKLWEHIDKKYRTGEEWDSRFADFLFGKEIGVKRRNRIIEKEEKRLREVEARRAQTAHPDEDLVTKQSIADITEHNTSRDELLKEEARIRRSLKALSGTDEVEKENARRHLRDLADKYGVTAGTDDDLIPSAHQILNHIVDRTIELNGKSADSILSVEASEQYQKWKEGKEPKKSTVIDYIKAHANRNREDEMIAQDKQRLNQFKEETDVAARNLEELRTSKGRKAYIKQAKETHNKVVKQLKEKIDKANAQAIDAMYDKKNVATLSTIQRSEYKKALEAKIQKKYDELEIQREYLAHLKQQLSEVVKGGFLRGLISDTLATGKKEIAKVEEKIANLERDIQGFQDKITALNDVTQTDEEVLPKPITPVTTTTEGEELTNFTDIAMADFIGDRAAYDDLLDRLWAMRNPGPLDEVLDRAYNIMGDVMDGIDHPFLSQTEQERAKVLPIIRNWLTKVLTEAGKVVENAAPTSNDLFSLIADLPLDKEEQADLAARLNDFITMMLEQNINQAPDSLVKEFIQDYGLTEADAVRLLEATRQELDKSFKELHELAPEEKQEEKAEEETPAEDNPEEEKKEEVPNTPSTSQIPDGPPPATNKGQSFSISITTIARQDGNWHDGMKAERVIKANALTHEYFEELEQYSKESTNEGVVAITPTIGTYVKKDRNSLNPNLNPLYVKPGYITAGTELHLAIDTEWDGTVNDDGHYTYGGPSQVKDGFQKYSDGKGNIAVGIDKLTGKVEMTDEEKEIIGNFPVKIVDPKSGTTVAYLPRTSWVEAQYEGTSDYRNVVDEKYGDKGELVYSDNVAKQKKELFEMRVKIAFAHNNGTKVLPTSVTSRSRGIAVRVEPARASEMLPDPSLKLAMVSQRTAKTSADYAEENVVVPPYIQGGDKYSNIPGVLLLDSSGRKNFEPLWVDRLAKAETDTVIRAIEVYLALDSNASDEVLAKAKEHADFIHEATGFDISTPLGLEGFINQYYYYTQAFDDQQMVVNKQVLGQDKRVPEFKLAISRTAARADGKSIIKAGVTFLGRVSYAGLDANGNINQEFRAMLEDHYAGLQSRYRNVIFTRSTMGVRGINSTGPLTEVVFRPDSGDFTTKEHASYNDMIKSYSMTTMEGRLKSKDGDYVYYAHPRTELSKEQVMAAEVRIKKAPTEGGPTGEEIEEKPFVPGELTPEEIAELENLDSGLDFYAPKLRIIDTTRSSAGTIPGTAVSLESLSDLHTFTPVEHRNGKTPAEVLQELRGLGIHSIPKGYNPFYTC